MILLLKYLNHKSVADITQSDIEQYIVFIKTVHQVGRAKCRSVASACVFFYKQVIKTPYILPSALYPLKQFILPNIMSQQAVTQLFAPPLIKSSLSNRPMLKLLFTKIEKQPLSINLGKGTNMQIALHIIRRTCWIHKKLLK